jgi:hypothetical protein
MFLRWANELDPDNEVVSMAMELLEANPKCSRLINVSTELAALVKSETKISNRAPKTRSSQEGTQERNEHDADALNAALCQTKAAEKLAPNRLVKAAFRGAVGDIMGEYHERKDEEEVDVCMADLPPITPAELDSYSSFEITEHPTAEAFLNDKKNTTTVAAALCCCIIL